MVIKPQKKHKSKLVRHIFFIFSWDFSLKDKPPSGRPNEADHDDIKALIEPDRQVTEHEIGKKLNMNWKKFM